MPALVHSHRGANCTLRHSRREGIMNRNRLVLPSITAVACLLGAPMPASSQVQQGKAKADTMPAVVVQRYFDAYNRHDLNGVAVAYDSVYLHENLGDGKGPSPITR